MFNTGMYGDDWYNNLFDFVTWVEEEKKRCRPKGPCGQDVGTTSGWRGLIGKYPTFEDAYTAYEKEGR